MIAAIRRGDKLRLCNRECTVNWAWSFCPVVQRFPRRGGNYNNGSNIGLGYENCNNDRGNANRNYGVRPRSQHFQRAARLRISSRLLCMGGVHFRPGKPDKSPVAESDREPP